jgi:hypothetical protein
MGETIKRKRSGPIAVLVLGGVLLLYPLSVGPAWNLLCRGYLPDGVHGTVYWPIHRLLQRSPDDAWWASLYDWYLNQWTPAWVLESDPDYPGTVT